MLLTEEDARKKLCGRLRYFTSIQSLELGKAMAEGEISSKEEFIKCAKDIREMSLCISAECNYWRWAEKLEQGQFEEDKGYCGRAGKP